MDSSNAPTNFSEAPETSLTQDWLMTLRHWLSNRWLLIAIAAVAIAAGASFSWGWLVAAGVAPLLLTALPCIAMCALGLCMMPKDGKSPGNQEATDDAHPENRALPAKRRADE